MNYTIEINDINSKKEKIAFAISMSVANGNEEEAMKIYPRFLSDLNSSTVFFLYLKSFESRYKIERRAAIEKLSDFLGYDTRPFIDHEAKVVLTKYFDDPSSKVVEFYKRNAKRYARFGLTYDRIKQLYNENKIDELEALIGEINKYQRFKFIQEFSSRSKENKEIPIIGKQFDDLKTRFKISTLDDLLTLSTEIDSFFVDTRELDNKQRQIIENDRDSFRRRFGVNKYYMMDEEYALSLKNQINQVYNFNLYRQALDNSNIRDFFVLNGYEYNGENLDHVLGMLMSLPGAVGICGHHDYGDGKQKHCFYTIELLKKTTTHQNMIITHEFIHALERINEGERPFWKAYRGINEAMTEYFALRAQEYLDGNIISNHSDNEHSPYRCAYTNMLPLVEVLEKSPYWQDFLSAKFDGNIDGLIKKIGRGNLIKIRDTFISCNCLEENDYSSQRMYADRLDKLIKKIYLRRNK